MAFKGLVEPLRAGVIASLGKTASLFRHPARWAGRCDALLVALKFIGDVKAGALIESVDGACCSEPPTSSPTTRIAVWVDFLGKIIVLTR